MTQRPAARFLWLGVFAFYLAASFLLLFPLPLLADQAVDNYGDPLLNVWTLAWDWHALTTRPLELFNANIFYPNTNTLAYSENQVFTALLAGPIVALTGNPVLAHNVVLLLSFPFSGLAAYALVRHVTRSHVGALAGGLIYAFAHYRLGQLSHIQLLTSFWLPLALLWLHRFVEKPNLRDAALVGLAVGLQWWTSIYYAFYLALAILLFAIWALATRAVRPRRTALLGGALAAGIAATIIAPGVAPYLDIRATAGFRRLENQEGATLADYVRPQPHSLAGRALGLAGEKWEHTLFPGVISLSLAGVAAGKILIRSRRSRPWERWSALGKSGSSRAAELSSEKVVPTGLESIDYYLLLAALAFILSLGPTLLVTRDAPPLIENMPYAWLFRALPPLAALRVPARLSVLVMLSISVLAGRGVAALGHRLSVISRPSPAAAQGRAAIRNLQSAILLAALVLEYFSLPAPHVPIETGASVPPVYRWLAEQSGTGAIFELPTAANANITQDQASLERIARQQYFSVYHWQPLVVGYSGAIPPSFGDVIQYAPAAASPPGLAFYRGLGVRWIVVHRDVMTWGEWATFAENAARHSGLSFVGDVGEASVFAVSHDGPTSLPERWRETNIAFGPELTLLSVDVPEGEQYTAGDAALVRLKWKQAPGRSDEKLAVSLQCADVAGQKVCQTDYYFPEVWPRGERLTQTAILSLLRDLPPGDYTLRAIVYRQSDIGLVGEPATLATFTIHQPDQFVVQRPLTAHLGESVGLFGADVEPPQVESGDTVRVTLYWKRLREIGDEYTVFAHLMQADGKLLAGQDSPPRNGAHPTSAWRDGETVIDRHTLHVPADAAPGTYSLIVGMYRAQTGERLAAFDEAGNRLPDDGIALGDVEIGR